MEYLLDTNVFAQIFEKEKHPILFQKFQANNGIIHFYLSEISMMEIYSVFGKWMRGSMDQKQTCNKTIVQDNKESICENIFIQKAKKKFNRLQMEQIYKLHRDIINQRGEIQSNLIPMNEEILQKSQALLYEYSPKHNFQSLDSIILATGLIWAEKNQKKMTLITLDADMLKVGKQLSHEFLSVDNYKIDHDNFLLKIQKRTG